MNGVEYFKPSDDLIHKGSFSIPKASLSNVKMTISQ